MKNPSDLVERFLVFFVRIYPLFVILLLAFGLRVYFAIGVNGTDPLLYAESAWKLANGQWPFNIGTGARRIGFYLPMAVLFTIFGAGEVSTLAWTMASSLITVCLIFAIGNLLGGRNAGFIAAFLWAINPLDILAATSGLPDGPMAMFATAAVYFYLLGKTGRLRKSVGYGLSALAIVYGFLVKELILFVGIFLVIWELVVRTFPTREKALKFVRNSKVIWPVIGILLLVFVVYGSLQRFSFPEALATTATDLFQVVFFHQVQIIFMPILLLGIFVAINKRWSDTYFLIAWFVLTAFIYEWAPINFSLTVYTPNTMFTSARNILFILPPLCVLGGYVLSRLIGQKNINALVLFPSGAIALLVLGLQLGYVDINLLATPAAIALLLSLPLLGILFFTRLGNGGRLRLVVPLLVLFMLGLAVFNPLNNVWGGGAAQILELRNLKGAVKYAQENPDFRVHFLPDEDPRYIRLFAFYSGYQYSEEAIGPISQRLTLIDTASSVDEAALIVDVLGSHDPRVNPTWWLVEEITQPASLFVPHPATLKIYKAIDQTTAESRLAQLQEELSQSPGDVTKQREVFSAAVIANKPFEALSRFFALRDLGEADLEMEQKTVDLLDLFLRENPDYDSGNDLSNGDFESKLDEWDASEAQQAGVVFEFDGANAGLRLINIEGAETIPISQHLTLAPNTAYVFEMEVGSYVGELAFLYWWSGGEEGSIGQSEDITIPAKYRHVFITPDWPSTQDVLLAPIVFFGAGNVEIGDVRFYEFPTQADEFND